MCKDETLWEILIDINTQMKFTINQKHNEYELISELFRKYSYQKFNYL